MEKEKVEAVLRLCEELERRAEAWKEATTREYEYTNFLGIKCVRTQSAPKEAGALQRISMELTRALADMRRRP